jgi:hypothetical protein
MAASSASNKNPIMKVRLLLDSRADGLPSEAEGEPLEFSTDIVSLPPNVHPEALSDGPPPNDDASTREDSSPLPDGWLSSRLSRGDPPLS